MSGRGVLYWSKKHMRGGSRYTTRASKIEERDCETIIEKQSVGECGPTIRTDTVN